MCCGATPRSKDFPIDEGTLAQVFPTGCSGSFHRLLWHLKEKDFQIDIVFALKKFYCLIEATVTPAESLRLQKSTTSSTSTAYAAYRRKSITNKLKETLVQRTKASTHQADNTSHNYVCDGTSWDIAGK
jgi:hypothetical protein